ncbi:MULTISPECIES: thioesterase family protein [unclassified Micromonospora]|uniref:acyl-CoA thioesterase n=1 Tax=unclassified Micromonospora TaxID=2617518 RepID=UPI001050EAF5|nr:MULTISPECIES: thioesterase family protein [unclassified Micromonospora]TDB80534.1 acyl-CoA thioesterase [Micromonospora sp. KC721]TDC43488.1 acyl-CoA thioesterase [Micromonospora sp. KC213]
MSTAFSVRLQARAYEVDRQGHVNQAVYTQYAEHARWEFLQAAGLTPDVLADAGLGPVLLKATVRFQRELRAGDHVDVSCVISGGKGQLIELVQRFQTPGGIAVARFENTIGLLDLATRRLVPDPRAMMRELAKQPDVLFPDTPEQSQAKPDSAEGQA